MEDGPPRAEPREDYGFASQEMRRWPGYRRLEMAEMFLQEHLLDGPKVRGDVFTEAWNSHEFTVPLLMKAQVTCGVVREVWAPDLNRYLWELVEGNESG